MLIVMLVAIIMATAMTVIGAMTVRILMIIDLLMRGVDDLAGESVGEELGHIL